MIGGSGRAVSLNIAYKTLNESGSPVTASETYNDDYSQYFIAYALSDIPTEEGVVISARAYVEIGDAVIYGNMTSFEIDKLEP